MFHEKIKKMRIEKNIKQEEVANAMFVTVQAYNQWERGKRELKGYLLEGISNYFGYTLEFMKSEHYKKYGDEFYQKKTPQELKTFTKEELVEYIMQNTSIEMQHNIIFKGKSQELFYMLNYEQRTTLMLQTIDRMHPNYQKHIFISQTIIPHINKKENEKMKFITDLHEYEREELKQLAEVIDVEVNKLNGIFMIENHRDLDKAYQMLQLWVNQIKGLRLLSFQPGNIVIEHMKDGIAYDESQFPFDYFGMDIEEHYYEQWENEWQEMNQ